MRTCQNFDEIIQSERSFLLKKTKNPIFTPIEYFFKSIFNIIIKELEQMRLIILVLVAHASLLSQLNYQFLPQISLGSFSLPMRLETELTKKIKLFHNSLFFTNNHQFNRYIWQSYNQDNIVYVSDISYLEYSDSSLSIKFGRDYLDRENQSKIFGLKDSPDSPSLDHLELNIRNSKYFRLKIELSD